MAPVHANAGELGQDCFEEQIKLAPGLLKKGGVVAGNQMSPATADNKIDAVTAIRDAFGTGRTCKILYSHMLRPRRNGCYRVSIRHFLRARPRLT